MISSAVLIPEETQLDPQLPYSPSQPNGTLKRRQSSISSPSETSKRPRLDSATGAPSSPSDERRKSLTFNQPPDSPPRRKSSLIEQDKSRSRRLFGALLGPAPSGRGSRAAPKPDGAAKRDEIHARQADRLRRDAEQLKAETKRKRDELERTRRREQLRWDEQALHQRHEGMRHAAGFLRTRTRPGLYFRPWELREEQKERVERQKREAEETITKEKEDWETKKAQREIELERGIAPGDGANDARADMDMDGTRSDHEFNGHAVKTGGQAPRSTSESENQLDLDKAGIREDEHNGEELEQGNEDDVIY